MHLTRPSFTNGRLRFILTGFAALFILTFSAINSYVNIVERHCSTCDSNTFKDAIDPSNVMLVKGSRELYGQRIVGPERIEYIRSPSNGSQKFQGQSVVNPERIEYIRTPPNICKNSFDFLLILVKSDASNIAQRMAIRQTWGNISHPKIKVIYLLGYYSIMHNTIEKEASVHKDILQGDFVDIYDNNINKTTMAYQWAVENCKNTQYLFFVDDDFFVNIYNIYEYLTSVPDHVKSHLFAGYIIKEAKPFRTKSSKWYITIEEFPDEFYPSYPGGGANLLSMNIARQMKNAFPYVRYIHIDDCYLGIVAKTLNLTLTDDKRFDVVYTAPLHLKEVFASHGYEDHRRLLVIWDVFLETVSKKAFRSFYNNLT